MGFKTWVAGEKLLATDLNGNFKSPATIPLHDLNQASFLPPAFNSDWSRLAMAEPGVSNINIFKNHGSKLDAPFRIGLRTRTNSNTPQITFLGNYFYSAHNGTTALYRYNNDDTLSSETALTISGGSLNSIQGIANDGTYLYLLDQLANAVLAGTVTATNGSKTITGSGTSFLSNFAPGDAITITGSSNGTWTGWVQSVASDTSLQLAGGSGFTFTGGSGFSAYRESYSIKKYSVSGTTITYISAIAVPAKSQSPKGVVADANYLYTFSTGLNNSLSPDYARIRKYDKTTGALVSTLSLGDGLASVLPIGITIDPDGDIRLCHKTANGTLPLLVRVAIP